MNVRTFLLGALCGAVVFSILDRLMEERERRVAARGAEAPRAEARSEARPRELQPAGTPAPTSDSPEPPVASTEATGSQDQEELIAEQQESQRSSAAQQPRIATEAEADARGSTKDAGSDEDDSPGEEAPAPVAQPDDQTWGPFMEQALRQFLASHRAAPQFDVLSIRCTSSLCEIRAAGFDESTWPVWGQVLYDIRQQPWADLGEVGSDAGRFAEYDGRYVLRAKLKRQPRQ